MDGIATEAAANVEQVIVADLDLAILDRARNQGSVQTFRDSQDDTLHTQFDGDVKTVSLHFGA
jgi:predicted amidohydrolase